MPYYTDWPDTDNTDNDKDGQTDEADESDTIIYSNGEGLVPISDGSFRCENESEFIRFSRSSQGWTATRKDGVAMTFGTTPEGRIQDDDGRIFKWLLEEMSDPNGNTIHFVHEKLDTTFQRYCTQIRYNPSENAGMMIRFDYEARPDIITDYRPRFELKTAFRCKAIRMTEGEKPIRSYDIRYEVTDDFQPLSLLLSITQIGRDGEGALPPAQFTYTMFQGNTAQPVNMPSAPGLSLSDGNIDLTDLNADGLPDILDTNDTVHDYYLNLGPGEDGKVRWSERTAMTSLPKPIYLGADSTQLADMDGDGQTDLLDLFDTDVRFYKIRQGSGLKWESGGLLPNATFNFRNPDTRLIDLNNDKLADVMRTESSDAFVWLNLRDGRWSKAFLPLLPNANLRLDQPHVRLADMNGDRLQDMVWLQDEICTYYPGRGFGEFGPVVTMSDPPFGITDESRLLMTDVNGDGRSDVLHVSGQVKVWLNLGLDPSDHSKGRFANPFTVSAPYTDSATVFRQCDINGNGSADILWNTHPNGADETFAFLDFAPNEQPYQLKTITNGIGKTITISYRSSVQDMIRDREAGQDWPGNVPFPVSVVAKAEVSDGLNTYATEFLYHDGYYDKEEKEFRGFAKAEKREVGDASAPDMVMAYKYDTGMAQNSLKGKPLMLEARTAEGNLFYQEVYTWLTRTLSNSAHGDERKVTFPYQQARTRNILEKGKGMPVQLKWEYEYDNYGNITKTTEHGRMDEGWDDERVTERRFSAEYPSGQSAWILDKLVEQGTKDENGTLAAHQRNYYDGSLTLGEVTKGNLTRTEDMVSPGKYLVSVQKDYDAYGNVTDIYDPLFGTSPGHYRELVYDGVYHTFPVQEIIHTGNEDVPTLTMSAAYDYGFGVMTSSTEFSGFTTHYGYDTFARLTSITKPPDTGPTVEYEYVLAHSLGGGKHINWVETRQREKDSGSTVDARIFYDGLGHKIMSRSEGETPGQIVVSDTVQFNARQQAWKKYLPYFETGTLDYADPSFHTGFTEHFYDALGREIRMIQPDGTYSETVYEPLTRTLRDENQTNDASPYAGCGMRYLEDGLQDKDGKGRLREAYEIVKLSDTGESLAGPVEWRTTYTYDLLDNLTGYTDSQNNRKIIEYDALGRKTFMNDPDRGHMRYEYDDAGNLIRTTDAKAQVIRYGYDGVNRLIAEYYGDGKDTPDVTYHYDMPFGQLSRGHLWESGLASTLRQTLLWDGESGGSDVLGDDGKLDVADLVKAAQVSQQENRVTARNTLGFLSYVRDTSGEEHISYDVRGRVKWVVKRIVGAEPGTLRNFYSSMEYDAMDRVTKLTYPDSSYVTYAYNTRGLLESVPNVIEQYNYNPVGQNALLQLACGAVTNYDYDDRLRLSQLKTVRSRDNLALQDFHYVYDGVSNITQINDKRSNDDLDAIGGELGIASDKARKFNGTQSFAYDSLYRLTQAANTAVYGAIHYRYDRIGNMVSKNASLTEPDPLMDLGAMSSGGTGGTSGRIGRSASDPPGPHAVTGTEKGPDGAMAFAYDDNGNMTADRGMSLSWDHKDRLAGLMNGANTAEYLYDYTDTRKKKTVSDGESGSATSVLYIDKFSEIRQGKLMKYVYAGTSRVARSDIAGEDSPLTPSCFYLHDHLGSTHLSLSDDGSVGEQMVNYPFGSPRLEYQKLAKTDYSFTGKERDLESWLWYFEARYLLSYAGRFLSVDISASQMEKPLKKSQMLNPYLYANNCPIVFTDPDGKWAVVDDALFAGGGALLGLAGQGISDLVAGKRSSWQDYLGSAVGGAVSGEIALYTANPYLAGSGGAGAGNIVKQIAKKGLRNFDYYDFGKDTLLGFSFAKVPGLKMGGCGGATAVAKQMITKFRNRLIKRVSASTKFKIFKHIISSSSGSLFTGAMTSGLIKKLKPEINKPNELINIFTETEGNTSKDFTDNGKKN